MKRINNLRNITMLTMQEDIVYQIQHKHAYALKHDMQVYIYSYDTCILQVDYNNHTIYINKDKYSITTSKQKTQFLRDLNEDLKGWVTFEIKPNHTRDIFGYTDISLKKLV